MIPLTLWLATLAVAVAVLVTGNDAVDAPMEGPPALAVAAPEVLRIEVTVLAACASMVLLGFLFMVYGSARTVLLCTMPAASAVLIGAAAVSLIYGDIGANTRAFAVALLGVTLSYPLHLFSHATGNARLSAAATSIWPTLRLSALGSSLAAASLGFSYLEGMAELALFTACGLVGASVCTRYVLPTLLPVDWRNPSSMPKLLAPDRAPTRRWARWQLIVAIALAGAGGSFTVQIAGAPAEHLWKTPPGGDAPQLLGLALSALALVLWCSTRSLSRAGVCALAIALAVIVDLGLLAAIGAHLSLFHLVAAIAVAGIALDYGLFFSRPQENRLARAQTLHGVCVSALSTVMVFGLLTLSSLPALRAIGATVALGVALAFVSTALLTRGPGPSPGPGGAA